MVLVGSLEINDDSYLAAVKDKAVYEKTVKDWKTDIAVRNVVKGHIVSQTKLCFTHAVGPCMSTEATSAELEKLADMLVDLMIEHVKTQPLKFYVHEHPELKKKYYISVESVVNMCQVVGFNDADVDTYVFKNVSARKTKGVSMPLSPVPKAETDANVARLMSKMSISNSTPATSACSDTRTRTTPPAPLGSPLTEATSRKPPLPPLGAPLQPRGFTVDRD